MRLALASTLARPVCFVPGAILALEEVERRIADQRATIVALRLGVPSSVTITDRETECRKRVERRWGG